MKHKNHMRKLNLHSLFWFPSYSKISVQNCFREKTHMIIESIKSNSLEKTKL